MPARVRETEAIIRSGNLLRLLSSVARLSLSRLLGDSAVYANLRRCRGSKVSHDRESSRWLRVRYDPR